MISSTRLQQLSESCWYGKFWPTALLSILLLPLAWLYSLAVALRRAAYANGFLKVVDSGIPVIVVGNISAGGAGKTPVVAWLHKQLSSKGYTPGIVSRGYGGNPPPEGMLVDAQSNAVDCGDEPLLLARNTGSPVAVCADRLAAIELLKQQGVDVVISDDGLQHYRMARDVEIAVVDGGRLFGNGRRLPAGPLRESVKRLQSVNATLVNGANSELGFRFDLRIDRATRLDGSAERSLQEFAGQYVWAVAGIGNPGRFYAALDALGIKLCPVPVADHGTVDLRRLRAEKDIPVLMTEKDAVKYASSVSGEFWVVPAEFEIDPQAANELMNIVLSKMPTKPVAEFN